MRWMLALGFAAFVFFGCEDEESEPQLQIVLVEAPTRLPFDGINSALQPFETTAVRFIARLEPAQSDVDSILCGIIDINGDQLDSFVLLDDGGQVEHWDHSTAESVLSLDSIAGDGLYSRGAYTHPSVTNYRGEPYTITFRAIRENEVLARAQHYAETWAPWVEITEVSVSPNSLPLCQDSMTVTATIKIDEIDSIVAVAFGPAYYYNSYIHEVGYCTPISGDTIWSGRAPRDAENWSHWGEAPVKLHVTTVLGGLLNYNLEDIAPVALPSVDLGLTQDTLWLRAATTIDTIPIKCLMDLCAEYNDEPIGLELFWDYSSHQGIEFEGTDYLQDCGLRTDSIAGDNIYSGSLIVFAENLSAPFTTEVRIEAGVVEEHGNHCDGYLYFVESVHRTHQITIVPPQ